MEHITLVTNAKLMCNSLRLLSTASLSSHEYVSRGAATDNAAFKSAVAVI